MKLSVQLPSQLLVERNDVLRIVVETAEGSLGLLPRRLDLVASLLPGILAYECVGEAETYVAVDAGVLIKSGREVRVSVRRAVPGMDLSSLHDAVAKEFLRLDDGERRVRSVLTKLETGFLRRLAGMHRE